MKAGTMNTIDNHNLLNAVVAHRAIAEQGGAVKMHNASGRGMDGVKFAMQAMARHMQAHRTACNCADRHFDAAA